VCRHGGEEFVIALAGCTVQRASEILDEMRARLEAAITVAGLPQFTVSFGVIEAGPHEDLPTVLSRADTALFQAKRWGRDQIVLHDQNGAVIVSPTRTPDDAEGASSPALRRRDPLKAAPTL
ncbi:MAG: hypothetical protein JWO63_1205, partial [Frankiales bacterium]|nr:hypothetical protein [Frankiales bacterium]